MDGVRFSPGRQIQNLFPFSTALTYGDVLSIQPFSNSIDSADLTGQNVIDAFEICAERSFASKLVRNLLQVSGLKVTYNITNPIGQRVVSVETRCRRCEPNSRQQYEPINRAQTYRVVSSNFVLNGGDGFTVVEQNKRNHV